MHLPRPLPSSLSHSLRSLGLLVAGVAATVALWVATTPPATSTVAPGAAGLP
jgi:hypothetical protein